MEKKMERIEESVKTLKICWMCPPKEQKQLIPYYMCLKGLYIHKLTTQEYPIKMPNLSTMTEAHI